MHLFLWQSAKTDLQPCSDFTYCNVGSVCNVHAMLGTMQQQGRHKLGSTPCIAMLKLTELRNVNFHVALLLYHFVSLWLQLLCHHLIHKSHRHILIF
jgi:hypothetical protein